MNQKNTKISHLVHVKIHTPNTLHLSSLFSDKLPCKFCKNVLLKEVNGVVVKFIIMDSYSCAQKFTYSP